MSTELEFLLVALATWYLAYAITSTHGPFGVFERIRSLGGGRWHGRHGAPVSARSVVNGETVFETKPIYTENGLLDCPICLAPWLALLMLIVPFGVGIIALALAGGAMILHSWSGWRFGNG